MATISHILLRPVYPLNDSLNKLNMERIEIQSFHTFAHLHFLCISKTSSQYIKFSSRLKRLYKNISFFFSCYEAVEKLFIFCSVGILKWTLDDRDYSKHSGKLLIFALFKVQVGRQNEITQEDIKYGSIFLIQGTLVSTFLQSIFGNKQSIVLKVSITYPIRVTAIFRDLWSQLTIPMCYEAPLRLCVTFGEPIGTENQWAFHHSKWF